MFDEKHEQYSNRNHALAHINHGCSQTCLYRAQSCDHVFLNDVFRAGNHDAQDTGLTKNQIQVIRWKDIKTKL